MEKRKQNLVLSPPFLPTSGFTVPPVGVYRVAGPFEW
jgi:hypothetical protein